MSKADKFNELSPEVDAQVDALLQRVLGKQASPARRPRPEKKGFWKRFWCIHEDREQIRKEQYEYVTFFAATGAVYKRERYYKVDYICHDCGAEFQREEGRHVHSVGR